MAVIITSGGLAVANRDLTLLTVLAQKVVSTAERLDESSKEFPEVKGKTDEIIKQMVTSLVIKSRAT